MRAPRHADPGPGARIDRLLRDRVETAGGWTPRQPDFDPPPAGLGSAGRPEDGRGELPVDVPVGPVGVAGLLRSARADPGRRGVLALVGVGALAAAVALVVMVRSGPGQQPIAAPAVVGDTGAATAGGGAGSAEVVVDVAGKVRKPGLVRLPAGSRVDDALRAAGGVLPGTSTGSLNLARKLADGEQVFVGVDPGTGGSGNTAGSTGGLLDLNSATAQDFDGLPGIGPVLADHIVSWRTEHGPFASVDQLREVPGIGEAKYSSIKTKVRV